MPPPKYSLLQAITIQSFILFVGLAILTAFVILPVFGVYKSVSGFQNDSTSGTDPTLVQIFMNLMTAYNNAKSKVTELGVESTPIEGTTLDKYLENQIASLQTLGQTCSSSVCTDAQLKDPNLLVAYTKANAAGSLGLPDITFDTLSVSSVTDAKVTPGATAPPDTQLPPAQMPASILTHGSQPSLDECKKYYTCSISANMTAAV